MCLPTDGPAPALVTNERRPFASTERRAVARQDRLAAHHVALAPVARSVVVDGERAQHGGRLGLALAHVRLLADEVLVLDLAPRHPGLDDVVLAVELEAERAVALLEPAGGRVDADAGGHDPVRRAGLRDHVPQPRALLDRHVELPAEVADVGDARGEHAQRAHLDRAAGGEREALVREVVAREARRDVARARAPEAERAPARGEVDDLRAAGAGVVGVPLEVRHAVGAAGDDAEVLVAEAHDGQVGAEAAVGVSTGV